MAQGSASARAHEQGPLTELLSSSRALTLEQKDASRLGRLAVQVAERLLVQSRALETAEASARRQTLAQLLESTESQLLSTALTDRVHRSPSPAAAVRVLRDLVERTGGGRNFPAVDRLQLRAARMFGQMVPKLTQKALLARLQDEAAPYLLDASPESLSTKLEIAHKSGYSVNLNYLGEEVLGEAEAQARLDSYCELAERADIDALSVKLSGIEPHIELRALDATLARLKTHLGRILEAGARRPGGSPLVYFDMETFHDLGLTEALVVDLLASAPPHARLGVAVQTYIPESLQAIRRLTDASARRVKRGGVPLRARLVKGANLQMERVQASLHRLALPIFPTKSEVDAHFKRVLRACTPEVARGNLTLGVGSHNLFDIAYALLVREMEQLGQGLELEMLQGMAGSVGEVVSKLGDGLLIYAPAVSPDHFSSAVSYLVRRLDENTAPENFMHDAPGLELGDDAFRSQEARFLESLSLSYEVPPETFRRQSRAEEAINGVDESPLSEPFDNAADTDFSLARNRDFVERELAKLQTSETVGVAPLIAGLDPDSPRKVIDGFDPSRPEVKYPIALASPEDIERALAVSSDQAAYWLARTTEERASLLLRVAGELEKNRVRLIAAMVLDAGKRVEEADIEVSEAVDFARYYAKSALSLEDNLDPRGVTVVTPPWNFPLAIPLGGALASLVAGNTVIMKPAPETPYVATLAVQICHDAGIPPEALSCVPCQDEDAAPLIQDPRVRAVILTGATETARLFKKMRPGLTLMAETGGKNAAYVAPVSDREQAILEVVRSAFGHAGQKCSALSVLVLHREVYEDESFKRQLLDATRSLPVGSAWDPQSIVTPLIAPPRGPLARIIERGESYGTWLLEPKSDPANPRVLSPGILWGVERKSFPHLTEFFGPILSVICAEDLHDALTVMNATSYGLTAGLFSLEESDHEAFLLGIQAGNVYINRGITGAVVARQPFGGQKESVLGPGAKAGGPDYVRQMTVCRASALREKKLLQNREEDYERAFDAHFKDPVVGTEVVGEENYLRYLPGPTAVVLGAGAEAMDIRFALKARQLCRAEYPLFIIEGEHASRLGHVLGHERAGSITAGGVEIVRRARELGVERLRAIGDVDVHLLQEASKVGLTVITDPVSDVGRQELALFLRAQSVSYSFHRHGNTSLYALSRLRKTLSS